MSDAVARVVTNLLDEAVAAASRSEWDTVSRRCREVLSIESDNSDALRLLRAAVLNKKSVIDGSAQRGPTAHPHVVSVLELDAFTKLETRAKWARIALGSAVLALVISFVSTFAEIQLLYDIRDAQGSFVEIVPQARIDSNDARQVIVALVWLVAFVAGVITFLFWLHSATSNLWRIGAMSPKFTPGWSVGWWFVPIANLFKPYQVLKEVWVGSTPDDPEYPMGVKPVWSWLRWYWVAYLVGGWLGWMVFQMSSGAEVIDELLASAFVSLLSDSTFAVAGTLLFVYVGEVTRRQVAGRTNVMGEETT